MNCFYLIDKPIWITSFDIIRKLRKKLNTKKIWHTWTLDPLATWLVLVAVWNYTKLIPYLENKDKQYIFSIMLDWNTDSYDLWTEIRHLEEEKKEYFKNSLNTDFIKNILEKSFSWEITQIPPKYSAIKIWWKKALIKAKSWEDFEMKKRKVHIKNIEITSFSYPKLDLIATVSEWTYIRSIAYDLWEIFWSWWYISFLRRTKIWSLWLNKSQSLDNFDENKTIDTKYLFDKNNLVELDDEIIEDINMWKKVEVDMNLKENINYFNYTNWIISNVFEYKNWFIKQKRKIV